MAVPDLHLRARAPSSRGERGPPPIAVRGPLTAVAPPAAEHRLQTRRLSSCGSRAQPPRGMRDPPRPGHEPASPALAGRLPTTAPPGKPHILTILAFLQTFKKYIFPSILWSSQVLFPSTCHSNSLLINPTTHTYTHTHTLIQTNMCSPVHS